MSMIVDATSPHEAIIVMTRIFDAPREKVWDAFTKPEHVTQWYGGKGFSNPVCEMDVRPGGHWRHVMRMPNGSEFEQTFVYLEVEKPQKLVWERIDRETRKPGDGPPAPRMTVTLEDLGDKTRWKLVALFRSLAEREQAADSGFTGVITEGCEKFNDLVKTL